MDISSGWKCATCGEMHDGIPLCFGAEAPAQWDMLSVAEREGSELGTSFCVIHTAKETAYFIRGHIEVPILDARKSFIWATWASLSEGNFSRTMELWDKHGREAEPAYFGWLSTALPVFPDTMFLKTMVKTQPVGEVPTITVEPTDHPLAVAQHKGVRLAEVRRWVELLLHG